MAAPKHVLRPRSKDAGPGEATRLCTVRRARAGARGAGCTRTGVTGSEINPYHHGIVAMATTDSLYDIDISIDRMRPGQCAGVLVIL